MAIFPAVARNEPRAEELRANPNHILSALNEQGLSSEALLFQDVLRGLTELEPFLQPPEATKGFNAIPSPNLHLTLWSWECHLQDPESNCFVACVNPAHIFSSLSTLADCITLSALSLLVQSNNISASAFKASVLRAVEISRVSQINATAVLSSILECAVSSCEQTSFGNCTKAITDLRNSNLDYLGSQDLGTFRGALSTYCDGFEVSISADIAGPGVLLSLILQALLALCAFGSLNVGYILGRNRDKHNRKFYNPNAALASAATDFQEAQSFLTFAIQVGTLATFRPAIEFESFAAIGEFILNLELIRTLAVNSILPVLLVQSVLQRTGIRWSYNLVLAFTTFVLAVVVDRQGPGLINPSYELLWSGLGDGGAIPDCGGHPNHGILSHWSPEIGLPISSTPEACMPDNHSTRH
ncbi:hypothetical protein QBC38DRAFT_487565 [Podospora fimiseda]|uniref:Uncharacterized protein n=1 Tax=Podospora fimiseda TaxID=252190 RepID=A0AAN7BHV5_9PEZI|nr:hypothetical protein QBC38DRAFT_487565 [Podospora fimiseda]